MVCLQHGSEALCNLPEQSGVGDSFPDVPRAESCLQDPALEEARKLQVTLCQFVAFHISECVFSWPFGASSFRSAGAERGEADRRGGGEDLPS